eukprot:Rhum_TRINITY_DN895_c0_g1::Rhum_TRINITY_DN895_c0_g1_i1::g.2606::m.2606
MDIPLFGVWRCTGMEGSAWEGSTVFLEVTEGCVAVSCVIDATSRETATATGSGGGSSNNHDAPPPPPHLRALPEVRGWTLSEEKAFFGRPSGPRCKGGLHLAVNNPRGTRERWRVHVLADLVWKHTTSYALTITPCAAAPQTLPLPPSSAAAHGDTPTAAAAAAAAADTCSPTSSSPSQQQPPHPPPLPPPSQTAPLTFALVRVPVIPPLSASLRALHIPFKVPSPPVPSPPLPPPPPLPSAADADGVLTPTASPSPPPPPPQEGTLALVPAAPP